MRNGIILFLLLSATSCTPQNSGQVQSIDIERVKKEVIGKDVQWVDVRTPAEFNAGHIDDAINIDISNSKTFTEKFEKLDKSKPVYIYCQVGGRSKQAAMKLKEMGFKSIFDYSGGYGEWGKQ